MFASSEEGSEKLEDTSDTRLVRCLDSDAEPDNVAEQEASVLETEDVEEVEEVEEIEQQADKTPTENIDEEEEEEEDAEVAHLRKILIKQQRKPTVTEPPTNPKFIVTLDGGYPMKEGDVDEFQMDEDDNNDLDLTVPEKIPRNVVRVQPQQLQQAISSDLADEAEDEGVFEGAPSKKPRAVDKCRFWPSCRNTGSCPFYHPTVPCKTFPNCRFGDKCLYIHPACKFGPACQNPACSYAHSGPRPSLMQPQMPVFVQPIRVPIFQMPPQQMYAAPMRHRPPRPSSNPQQMKCKFFPNCTDMNCRFAHPKPCRYGLSCTIKSTCPYSHPELPAKGQLKWVSSATSN